MHVALPCELLLHMCYAACGSSLGFCAVTKSPLAVHDQGRWACVSWPTCVGCGVVVSAILSTWKLNCLFGGRLCIVIWFVHE